MILSRNEFTVRRKKVVSHAITTVTIGACGTLDLGRKVTVKTDFK